MIKIGKNVSKTVSSEDMAWWQKAVAYEIYVNSFQDSDGDGFGDLNGIRSRLDYLSSLGVGIVWLTPVYASPMMDNGYDVADYYSINPRYGSMEDMDALIMEAKERGIRIVMDLVYNHTSDQNEWFKASSADKENEYSGWYIWRDAREDGSAPNNWRSIFGGSAWTWCESRGQYYLHTFAPQQPDLNWEKEEVRQALYDIANFWIDKGAGGFRMDAIPYIKKPVDFSDGPADDALGMADIHKMTVNTDGILDFLKEFKEKVTAGKDVFTVAEANGVSADELKYWVGEDGAFDMLFEFSHINLEFVGAEVCCKARDWKLTDLKRALGSSQRATADNGWYPVYFENHDKQRSIDHYFPEGADPILAGRAMAVVLFTLRGTPFIYQGQELGYSNASWNCIDDFDDLNAFSQYEIALEEGFSEEEALEFISKYSRDNARTPMQWDSGDQAGFTTGRPWLPVHNDYKIQNVESESADPASVLSFYRQLAALRAGHSIFLDGTYEEYLADHEKIYAYGRRNGKDKVVILVNFTGDYVDYGPEEIDIKEPEGAKVLLSSYDDIAGIEERTLGRLRPYEALIIECLKD